MLKFKMKSWLIALVILLGIEKPLMADPVLCGNTYCAGECLAILRLTLEAEDPAHLCNRVQCELIVDFVQVGLFDNGTTSVPGTHTGYSIFAQGIGKIQGCTELAYDNFITALPPIDSQNSCFLPAHSSINVDSRSLLETIPLVGPPFNLNYTSERFRTGFKYQPKTLGLGGWEPSIVHHYDKVNKVVYFGDGGAYPVEAVQTNDGYYATNPSGSEVYYFNTDGVHQQTKNSLTGFIEWQFNYSPTGQILSISDRFNNTTSFVYSSSGISITSPFGQVSTLILDASGFLKSVRNPNNEVYELTNNASGFLINFQKPGGQKSTVTYDSGGFVLKDLGTGGDFISLLQNFNSSTGEQTITSSTALDRKTSYVTTADSNGSTHSITHPFGQYSTSNTPTEGAGNSSNSLGHQGSYVLTSDPRFGSLAPYKQISNFSIANSNINLSVVTNKSAQLSNVNDPLSLTSLLTTVTVQNDASRTFSSSYTAANKLVTNTSAVNRVTYQQLNDLGLLSSVQVGPLVPVLFSYDDRGRQRTTYTSQPKRPYIFVYI